MVAPWIACSPSGSPDRASPRATAAIRTRSSPSGPGIGRAHARELWTLVADELEPVDGGAILARDAGRLHDPPPARGVRPLPASDPLLLGRDRERLLPDPAHRKRVHGALGVTGVVLADGASVALWRPRKQGKRLEVTVEAFGRVPKRALEAEAERLLPHRGCTSLTVAYV